MEKKKKQKQNDQNPLRKRDVIDVLNNQVTFNMFVQHLNAEFSLGMYFIRIVNKQQHKIWGCG